MVFRILAVLAEFERDLVSERTRAARALNKSQGQRIGQIPFGYRLAEDGVNLLPHADEQATLSEMRALRSRGLTSQQIADEMNQRGKLTKKRVRWTLFTARSVAA